MTKKSIVCFMVMFALLGMVDARDSLDSETIELAVNDFSYSCWLNGWRKNANDSSADIFGIETSRYGFTLDVGDFGKARFGTLSHPGSYEQALKYKAQRLEGLPDATLLVEIELDGTQYLARTCKAGQETDVRHLSSVRLWESGRYVQHYDFLELDFRSSAGERLPCEAVLDLVAWPGSLTFNLTVSLAGSFDLAILRLGLKSQAGNWAQEVKVQGPWKEGQQKSISMTCDVSPAMKTVPADRITVKADDGQNIPVRFDAMKDCYVASVGRLNRDWKTGYTDIRDYDDFKVTVEPAGEKGAVPFLLDMRPPANITGVCPILCYEDGQPTGIPVQLSKNWHYGAMGPYLMAYTLLPAAESTTYILRLAYGFYGTLPSASHAQLSLIGYNDNAGNGRWDQLAIGCWGETICFDMDMSLVDVAITDIRMLMTRQGSIGRKWGWTEAGWGGDWLNIQTDTQKKFFWTHLKTAYLSQGPCLTQVKYNGYCGANQEVDFSAQVQTLRTDDYSRSFQRLTYTFTKDVSAKAMWLFKLGRTYNYHTPHIAYGNAEGLLAQEEAPNTLSKDHLVLDHVTLAGPAPYWVAYPGATHTSGDKPNGYRALIIRQYQVIAGGKTYSHPTLNAPVYKANPTNLDIELLPPADVTQFAQGDRIDLDLELITLPREVDDYYGPNEAFRRHLADHPNSWKTTFREATGNDLKVRVSGGKALQMYPLVIQVNDPEVTVQIHGGVGAVPIQFQGLASSTGYRLDQRVKGQWVRFDQSVNGNDFWQTDYDPGTKSFTITFNLPLDGQRDSTWILTGE